MFALLIANKRLKIQRGNQKPQIEGHTTQWQKKKNKRTNYDLQNITQKTKDRATRTPLKTEVERRYSGRVGSLSSTCGTRDAILVTNAKLMERKLV